MNYAPAIWQFARMLAILQGRNQSHPRDAAGAIGERGMKPILFTSSAGVIERLCDILSRVDHEVVCVDNFYTSSSKALRIC